MVSALEMHCLSGSFGGLDLLFPWWNEPFRLEKMGNEQGLFRVLLGICLPWRRKKQDYRAGWHIPYMNWSCFTYA